MGQINHKWDKVLEPFFEDSNHKFTIREISRKTKIPKTSVQRYLKLLEKEGHIKENIAKITPYFKFKKSSFMIDKIIKSGLIDYIEKKLKSSVIIVFGSIRKGEYEKGSDIDIFVESSVKGNIDLIKFERKFKHKIQLFIKKDIKELPSNLFNNVINGIKVSGYINLK